MTKTRDIIIKLKEVRDEKGYSLNDIVDLVEKNGDYISRSTVQRVFADGSEGVSFRYEESLRPIIRAMLDIETVEESDNVDIATMKVLLKFKIQKIEELEQQIEELESKLDKEKIKYHEKLDKEREQSRRSIEFLKEQISYKDKRMDLLLQSVEKKDKRLDELVEHIMNCPFRKTT